MSNPRADIEDLKLQGSPNLSRALKRQQGEEEASVPLTEGQKSEIARLDELISLAMRACRRGQIFRGKRNPAFANLSLLVKARKELLQSGKKATKPIAKSPMEQLEEALKGKAN